MTSTSSLSLQNLSFTKNANEINQDVESLVRSYQARIDALVRDWNEKKSDEGNKRENFRKSFLRLADADGHASLASVELTLPALVSGDAETRSASSNAKKTIKNMFAHLYARSDVYACLEKGAEGAESAEEKRLVEVTLEKFRQAGASLENADTRTQVSALDARCADLAFQIEQNINEDCTEVGIAEEDLEGCSLDFINALTLKPAAEGEKRVRMCSVKAPTLMPILARCTNENTRKTMLEASQRKCISPNSSLLDELLTARHNAAQLLGFGSHADRMLAQKMAGSVPRAESFCLEMLTRLQPLRDADLSKLEARKQQLSTDNNSKRRKLQQQQQQQQDDEKKETTSHHQQQQQQKSRTVNIWDTQFLSDLLKREELALDDEKIKEFFPLEGTITRILKVYEDMLGLTFQRSTTAPVWHEEVVVFEVHARNGQPAGYLYLDQFPRPGKFGHQMVVPLTPSFVDSGTGTRCLPACVNISNLARPQGKKPALLRFEEMRTLFHELGHAMHCLCTSTTFSSLSWAWPMVPWPGGVEQDFLELPSMALENFATEPALLSRVASHYSLSSPSSSSSSSTTTATAITATAVSVPELGADVIGQLKALDKWMIGITKSKYYAMSLADLQVHSQAPPYSLGTEHNLSVQQLYSRLLEKYTTLTELSSTHPCASWYHLVIGYDAGYYGYGWSDVYAADVFEAMQNSSNGLLSQETGAKLRDDILAPCAARSGFELLRAFLNREPTVDAWCRRFGIEQA